MVALWFTYICVWIAPHYARHASTRPKLT